MTIIFINRFISYSATRKKCGNFIYLSPGTSPPPRPPPPPPDPKTTDSFVKNHRHTEVNEIAMNELEILHFSSPTSHSLYNYIHCSLQGFYIKLPNKISFLVITT